MLGKILLISKHMHWNDQYGISLLQIRERWPNREIFPAPLGIPQRQIHHK